MTWEKGEKRKLAMLHKKPVTAMLKNLRNPTLFLRVITLRL